MSAQTPLGVFDAGAEHEPPPPTTVPHEHHWWSTVAIVVIVVVGMLVGILQMHERSRLVLSEDFSHGPGSFLVGTTDSYAHAVVGGQYEIVATAAEPGAVASFAPLTRTVDAVEVSADITMVDDPLGATYVGMSCLDDPADSQRGYAVYVSSSDIALVRLRGEKSPVVLAGEVTPFDLSDTPFRVRISCVPVSAGMQITGSIDGGTRLVAVDSTVVTFEAAALEVIADHAGDAARFDNVTAVVPGG